MVTLKKTTGLVLCPDLTEFGALDDESKSLMLTKISYPRHKLFKSKTLKIPSFWVSQGFTG